MRALRGAPNGTCGYKAANQITTINTSATTAATSYDGAGNLTDIAGSNAEAYDYDDANRAISI